MIIYSFIPSEEKTILHSEDKDSLRRAAQLKIFRKVEDTIPDIPLEQDNRLQAAGQQIEFVINDSTSSAEAPGKEVVTVPTGIFIAGCASFGI